MLNQVSEYIDSIKRSNEIDSKNARKAVKDKDFVNVRAEEGFKNIIEVVVIESLRQGYHTIGGSRRCTGKHSTVSVFRVVTSRQTFSKWDVSVVITVIVVGLS